MLEAQGLPEARRLLSWLRDLVEALDYLHSRGLIHRDLKPGNVMIEPDDRARLLDFGLARQMASGQTVTATGMIVGTPDFMAPEIFRGERPTRETDLFALAALAYWGLVGLPPFRGPNPGAILRAQRQGPESVKDSQGNRGPALDAFFGRALAIQAELRPDSGEALISELEGLLLHDDRQGDGPPPGPEATRVLAGEDASGPGVAETRALSLAPVPASVPVPARGPGGFRGGLAALGWGLILLMAFWMWNPSGSESALPVLPPAEAPAPREINLPFPVESCLKMRERLTSLLGMYLTGTGGPLPEGQAPDSTCRLLLDGDPRGEREILRRFPEISAFAEWAQEPGHLENLPVAFREQLEDTDRYFQGENQARPFHAYLGLRKLPELGPVPEEMKELFRKFHEWLPSYESFTGWEATALRAFGEFLVMVRRKTQVLELTPGDLPAELQIFAAGGMITSGLDNFLSSNYYVDSVRTASFRWVRAEAEVLHRGLLATGRVLREEPEKGPRMVLLANEVLVQHLTLLRGHLMTRSPEQLIGPRHSGGSIQAYLDLQILREQRRASPHLGWSREPFKKDIDATLEALRSIPFSSQPLAHILWLKASRELWMERSESGFPREAGEIGLRVFRSGRGLGPGFRRDLLEVLAASMLRLGEDLGMQSEELRTLIRKLKEEKLFARVLETARVAVAKQGVWPNKGPPWPKDGRGVEAWLRELEESSRHQDRGMSVAP